MTISHTTDRGGGATGLGQSRSQTRARAAHAFTLTELVLVLVIVAIAVGVAAPSLSSFVRSRDLSNTATRFIAATRFARTQSISQAVVYRVNIDSFQNRWWLTKADETGVNFVPADPSGKTDCTLSPKLGITCSLSSTNDVQVIEFHPAGQTDPATVTLTGPDNGSIQIACDSRFDLYRIVPHEGGIR